MSMSMSIKMSVSNPGDILFTLKTTMPLSSWAKLREQLQPVGTYMASWPARGLIEQIDDAVLKASKEFYPVASSEETPNV